MDSYKGTGKDYMDKIKSAGFDSKTTVKQLENIYTGHDK